MSREPSGSAKSNSSDLFESDDPELFELLQNAVLPGDLPSAHTVHLTESVQIEVETPRATRPISRSIASTSAKRPHSIESTSSRGSPSPSPGQVLAAEESDTYGASKFGHFGEYMRRKRAKLQIQNANLDSKGGGAEGNQIFSGLAIYINGFTQPSVQELRQLIVRHGGIFQPYLDKKSIVTHIITCSLTPAKVRDFKHMKVVTPSWLLESASAGTLLPWQNFIFRPGNRVDVPQGVNSGRHSLSKYRQITSNSSSSLTGSVEPVQASTSNKIRSQSTKEFSEAEFSERMDMQIPEHSTSRSLYITDPATREDAARVPGYSAFTSNPLAERVMANPEWRSAHTSVAPDFIEGFYRNSRLHHLSTWKAELKNLVMEAVDRAEKEAFNDTSASDVFDDQAQNGLSDGISMKGAELAIKTSTRSKGKERAVDGERIIMHCDFDCFFVSAGLVSRPELRGRPVVVCHSQGEQGGNASTSEIASSSYEARSFGIKNGMSLQQARKLCPAIVTIPYEFERYKQISLQFYTILMRHADDVQAVSVDEALIDVTSAVARLQSQILREYGTLQRDAAKEFAETIREEVRRTTCCGVSIGIAHNIQLARLATRRAKPAGSFHLLPSDVQEFLAPLDVGDLHGFGYSTRKKVLEKMGVSTLGELAKKSRSVLCDALGKGTGETLYKAIRGIDDRKLESDKPRKSVSCDINYGIRFENNEQAKTFIYQMAEEVARRLDSVDMRGKSLTLKIMKRDPAAPVEAPKFMGHGICETFSRQSVLMGRNGHATSDSSLIGDHAWKLLKSFSFDPKELRGIGIQIQKLEPTSGDVDVAAGQSKLPFKLMTSPSKKSDESEILPVQPEITIQSPTQEDEPKNADETAVRQLTNSPVLDLPSFSQVDRDVFYALPDDLRKELEAEYSRRSHSPAVVQDLTIKGEKDRSSEPPADAKRKITVKGVNVKRITRQLAPRNRPVMTSPAKNALFSKRSGPSAVHISEAELRKLGIDPAVFAELPVDMQREQLVMARHAKSGQPMGPTRRLVLKPDRPSRPPSAAYRKKPPPQAKYPQPPLLKQQGKTKGEKLYFTDTDDIQGVIESWVDGFRTFPPNSRDVEHFQKFLVQCITASDTGLEKAVAIMKWWMILLKRHWEFFEHTADRPEEIPEAEKRQEGEHTGLAWWEAFRKVKKKLDEEVRKKFGGSLSLR